MADPTDAKPIEAETPSAQRSEKHDGAGWRERVGWLEAGEDGRPVSPHALAGALADAEPDQVFTQTQVEQRIQKFLKRKGVKEDS